MISIVPTAPPNPELPLFSSLADLYWGSGLNGSSNDTRHLYTWRPDAIEPTLSGM